MAPSKRKGVAVSRTTRSSKASSSSQQPIPMEVQNPSHHETSDDHTCPKQPTMLRSHTKKAILEAIKHKQIKASAKKSDSEDSKEESESSSEDDCDEEKLSEIVKGVCIGIKSKEPALEEPNEYEEEPNEYEEETIPTSQNESSDDESSDSQVKQHPKKAILESKEVSDQESESSEDDSDDEKQCAMVKGVSCGVKRKEPAVSVGPSRTNKEAVDTKIEKLKRLKLELEQMRTQSVKKQCEDLVKSFSMK